MNKIFVVIILLVTSVFSAYAQPGNIKGKVYELDTKGMKVPIPFVNVYWNDIFKGTVTDEEGEFVIEKSDSEILEGYHRYRSDKTLF